MKKKHLPCGICGKTQHGMFCRLTADQVVHLNKAKTVYQYPKGKTIFYEGNPAFAIYCLHEGYIKLFKTCDRGERHVIRLLGPGDVLGFRAVLADEDYAATAEAVTSATCCVIPKDTLRGLLQSSPDLAFDMMSKLAVELRISEEHTLSLINKSVVERLAELLLRVAPDMDSTEPVAAIPLQRTEMAQIIGTTPETLSRSLQQLARRMLIDVTRTSVSVLDRSGLKRIAHSRIPS
jgi:CRP-like cAMP-binding protein